MDKYSITNLNLWTSGHPDKQAEKNFMNLQNRNNFPISTF